MRLDSLRSILPVRAALGRWLPLLLLITLSAPLLRRHLSAPARHRRVHYTFRLTLRDDTDEIEGEASVDLRFVQEGLQGVPARPGLAGLGQGDDGLRRDVPGHCRRNSSTRTTGCASTSTRRPRPASGGHSSVSYRGIPSAGLRIGKNRHGERTFFSENWPDKARRWLPMVDHPYDKATSEFLVTAPARYQVVSNGLLQEETDLGDGRRLTHWKQSVPIASWLNALGVAQFTSHHAGLVKGVPLETWVYHQDRDAVVPALENPARRVLEFFSEHIGPFPYEKLAGVQAAGISGGMELASAIFYGERSVSGRGVDNLVAHEVAHQWFGDAVTERDWDDVWLSEGFATYFALLFLEHDRGRDAFVAGLKRSREIVLATEKRNPHLAVIHDNLADMRQVAQPPGLREGRLGAPHAPRPARHRRRSGPASATTTAVIATATSPPTTSAASWRRTPARTSAGSSSSGSSGPARPRSTAPGSIAPRTTASTSS